MNYQADIQETRSTLVIYQEGGNHFLLFNNQRVKTNNAQLDVVHYK